MRTIWHDVIRAFAFGFFGTVLSVMAIYTDLESIPQALAGDTGPLYPFKDAFIAWPVFGMAGSITALSVTFTFMVWAVNGPRHARADIALYAYGFLWPVFFFLRPSSDLFEFQHSEIAIIFGWFLVILAQHSACSATLRAIDTHLMPWSRKSSE